MRSAFRAAVAVAAVLVSSAWAAATDFVIPKQALVVTDGNFVVPAGKAVPLGELVDVTVPRPSEPVPHLHAVSYEWKVLEQGKERKFKTSGDQSNIWYAAGIKQRTHQVFCVVTYLFVVRDKPDPKAPIAEVATRTAFLYAEVSIGGTVPDPVPPGPGPAPGPSLPDGRYKLARATYDLVAKADVTPEDRAKAAKALAAAFRGVASAIRAGAVKDTKAIVDKTAAANQSALRNAGVSVAAWERTVVAIQEVVYDLYESDKISSPDDFAAAWDEIAAGFEPFK